MIEIKIDSEYIKLGQLLKLAAIADSGIHAKILILDGFIEVDGEIEKRRGRKIYPANIVKIEGNQIIKVKSNL